MPDPVDEVPVQPEALHQEGLQRLGETAGLLRTKGSSEDLAAYREFVIGVATKVAAAHKEDGQEVSPPEQAVFGRLSVFRAAFDLDAAAAAAGFGTVDADDVADIVWSLADESLLVVDRAAGHTRYRMLETVRAYAAARLDDGGEAPATRQHLADYYLARYFPSGSTVISSGSNLAGIESLAVRPPGSDELHILVINRQIGEDPSGGRGRPVTVRVDVRNWSGGASVTARQVDSTTPLDTGPPAVALPSDRPISVTFTGYGAAFVKIVASR